MKYRTGHYLLLLFTKHGDKAQTIPHDNFLMAQAEGEDKIKNPPYASFVIIRVLHNSVDTHYPWTVRPEDVLEIPNAAAD